MDRDLHRAHAELDESHWWFVGRRRIIDATLRRHVGPRPGPVVDVGCGAGGLLPMLATYGPVTAVEVDPEAAHEAKQRNPEALVINGSVEEAIEACPEPQLATAFDVIEHVDDDVALLRTLCVALSASPTGSLCVTVPALPWLWSEHDVRNQHRRRYTASSLRIALQEAGFQVVHVSSFNSFLFPLVAVARIVERLRGPSPGGDFDRSAGPLDRVLRVIFSSERFFVPRISVPIGVSLIAVAVPRR